MCYSEPTDGRGSCEYGTLGRFAREFQQDEGGTYRSALETLCWANGIPWEGRLTRHLESLSVRRWDDGSIEVVCPPRPIRNNLTL
jgi:hypothetical protein